LAHSASDIFAENLRAELAVFRLFLGILQDEQDALVKGNTDHLTELAKRKTEQVSALSRLAENRSRLLADAGFGADRQGLEAWLERHDSPSNELRILWNDLLQAADAARQTNETNGSMIENRLRHNQQALAVLQSAANQASLYGPDGQTYGFGSGRPLGKV
jgi:flagella synthesis protein FlgN